MKLYALYLPQFHRIPENDVWWGEGFTDWDTARNAQKMFPEHNQPHMPFNGYEYNLLDKDAMKWQAETMQRYGIDGVFIYHYWFENGRRVLEKPAENLLKWTDIDMPFCFCWANERWMRTWDRFADGNVWCSVNQKNSVRGNVLLEQKYGAWDDWKTHFEYLLPFFKDCRYVHIEGRPAVCIYKPSDILCFEDMKECWDRLSDEHNIPHVYFICGYQSDEAAEKYDMCLYHSPRIAQENMKVDRRNGVRVLDYEMASKYIIARKATVATCSFSGFVGYDDTPRHQLRGTVYINRTPEKFRKQLTELMAKNEKLGAPFTVINAWNEWGEGMHLEPDEKDGYKYLEQIQKAKEEYPDILDSIDSMEEKYREELSECILPKQKRSKDSIYLNLLDLWLVLKEDNKSLEKFFYTRGYEKICIYGMGVLGEHLYEELRGSVIEILYVVDRDRDRQYPIQHFTPDEELPDADAMIVTAVLSFANIRDVYKDSFHGRIISIEEVLHESR